MGLSISNSNEIKKLNDSILDLKWPPEENATLYCYNCSQQLAALTQENSEPKANLSRFEAELSSYTELQQQLLSSQVNLTAEVRETRQLTTSLASNVSILHNSLAGLQDQVDTGFMEFDSRYNTTQGRLDKVETEDKTLHDRLDVVDGTLDDFKRKQTEINNTQNSIQDQVNSLKSSGVSLSASVVTIVAYASLLV